MDFKNLEGKKVIHGTYGIGTVSRVKEDYIYIDFGSKEKIFQRDVFLKGVLKLEEEQLQNVIDLEIVKIKQMEQERLEKVKKINEIRVEEAKKTPSKKEKISYRRIYFKDAKNIVRLDPKEISFNNVKKSDIDLIKNIFDKCDEDIEDLYRNFTPKMAYPKSTSYSRAKYCVAFVCKYLDHYILRVFSRNDIYKKRERTGVTILETDTTEIIRAVCINGKDYTFTKNISYSHGFYNNTTSYDKWHVSELGCGVILNEIIRMCECGYLNDYFDDKNIGYEQYSHLLLAALRNNKVEILFKNKMFNKTFRINNLVEHFENFTSKQIDFASKHNVINSLPIIKEFGIYDMNILSKMELVMTKYRYGRSIYTTLKEHFTRLNFDTSVIKTKLIAFFRKLDNFDSAIYEDFINLIARRHGITVKDFFNIHYIEIHDRLYREYNAKRDENARVKYELAVKKLLWINREENGYFIRVPNTIFDFKKEGDMQHNCVYQLSYYNKVINNQSIIVFLRKDENIPYVTIEYDYETFGVIQAYKKFNVRVEDELYKYIVDLGKRLYLERYSQ